ncbi:MAG TPA: 2OG-Fe dioxygenase family protein [Allosphingosinicella sp.]
MGFVATKDFPKRVDREVARLPHPLIQSFRDRFEKNAFAVESGAAMQSLMSTSALGFIEEVKCAGRNAPFDRNPGGEDSLRRRYYSTAIYSRRAPNGMRLTFLPHFEEQGEAFTTYVQPAGANRDYSTERRFEPWPPQLLEHDGLRELVELCFRATPASIFPAGVPDLLKVGLHLISLQPSGSRAAVSSPNRAHFDGEYVTYIILAERTDVIRGDSLIAPREFADSHPDDIPDEARLFEGTLKLPLDILGTDDRRISHYVYPVFARRNGNGRRTVILIDFTPLVPETSDGRLEEE